MSVAISSVKHPQVTEEICVECVVPMSKTAEKMEEKILKCVRCPFCKRTVNAILTKTHINCPSCEASVALE